MTPFDVSSFDASPGQGPLDIAVVGAGIAGLGAAWLLSRRHRVTIYERNDRLGGHSNTVDVEIEGRRVAVDTGFIVYNEHNYPNLRQLFRRLSVETQASDMSFAVSLDRGRVEYSGGSFLGMFAQPLNVLRREHWSMIADIVRFFREAPALLESESDGPVLGDYLARHRYSRAFVEDHLLPMGAAIWSVPVARMLDFPARSFVQFFRNHGLLQMNARPQWRTVTGGSREYVTRLAADMKAAVRVDAAVTRVRPSAAGVLVYDRSGIVRRHDRVVIAAHADEALAMLADPTPQERSVLGAFGYQANLAILHRDRALMPRRRRAWASWNYLGDRGESGQGPSQLQVSVTYWMNRLQRLACETPLFLSLNPIRPPREGDALAAFEYHHPAFDAAAFRAQRELPAIQGARGVYFCGSYCGYGFHEDALVSGLEVAESLGAVRPWTLTERPVGAGAGGFIPARAAAAAGD